MYAIIAGFCFVFSAPHPKSECNSTRGLAYLKTKASRLPSAIVIGIQYSTQPYRIDCSVMSVTSASSHSPEFPIADC